MSPLRYPNSAEILIITVMVMMGLMVLSALSRIFGLNTPPPSETARPTSPHSHQANAPGQVGQQNILSSYRTKNGASDYRFSFEEVSRNNWRAYILKQPSYRSRSTTSHATHRLQDGNRLYVCTSKTIGSLAEARHLASLWADCTEDYIRRGQRF